MVETSVTFSVYWGNNINNNVGKNNTSFWICIDGYIYWDFLTATYC